MMKVKYVAAKLGIIGKLAKKHNVTVTGYPIAYSKTQKGILSFIIGTLIGENKDKKAFIRSAKASPLFLNIEVNKDFIVATLKIVPVGEPLYNPKIIYAKPALFLPDGTEMLEVASFERKHLEKLMKFLEKVAEGKLVSIRKEKISDISVTTVAPSLTEKQKDAFKLAVNNGYYNYPRKIDIKKLAKISKINFSAYHAHLRKAENKLLPYTYKIL